MKKNLFLHVAAGFVLSGLLALACQGERDGRAGGIDDDVIGGNGGASDPGELPGGGEGGLGGSFPIGRSCETGCGERARCDGTLAEPVCVCLDGYDGQRCDDVDECLDAPCGVGAECRNFPGTYSCVCSEGYLPEEGGCLDDDECDASPCAAHASCENSSGGYECACDDGYVGSGGFCKSESSCSGVSCGGHGDCAETPSGYACLCDVGFAGKANCGKSCATLGVSGALEAWVRLLVGKSEGDLVPGDVANLEQLSVRELGLTSLDGLECFPNLRKLDVSGNPLEASALNVLADVTRLESLTMDCTNVENLGALIAHPSLRNLSANLYGDCGEKLTTLSALGTLPELTALSLAGQGLTSLGEIGSLRRLRTLKVSENPLDQDDFAALASPLLEHLLASGTELENLAFLSKFPRLVELDVSRTPLGSLDGIGDSSRLANLRLDETNVGSLESLGSVANLGELSARKTGLASIEAVAKLSKLVLLDVEENAIEDFSSLVGRARPGYLLLGDNPGVCPASEESKKLVTTLEAQGAVVYAECSE